MTPGRSTQSGATSQHPAEQDIIARATIAPLRRWLTIVPGFVAGTISIWYGLTTPLPTLWASGLAVVIGLMMVGGALWLLTATRLNIKLTQTHLYDSTGVEIALVSNMRKLERGTISYKPAHGFVIVVDMPVAPYWRPGSWWRTGQRVGVGGFLRADEVKVLGDAIQALIAARSSGRS